MDPRTFMILTFFSSTVLLFLAIQETLLQRRRVYRSLQMVRPSGLQPTELHRRNLAEPASRRLVMPGMRRVGKIAMRFTPFSLIAGLERDLVYAGSPAGWDAERMLSVKILGAAGAWAAWMLMGAGGPGGRVLVSGLVAFGVYKLPNLVVRTKYVKRQEALRKALPDTLDLLSIIVEAGLAFDQAVSRVSDHVGGPLGEELHRLVREIQLGKARADALRAMAERSTVPELRSFVLSMVQADVFGISIAKVLNVQAKELRTKRRQSAEERAQKIPVKIVFPLIFCIFPSLFVVLLGPAAIRIYEALLR